MDVDGVWHIIILFSLINNRQILLEDLKQSTKSINVRSLAIGDQRIKLDE
jgi:hypothetical protein